MISLSSVLAHNPDCPVREVGEGLVIMAAQGDATHSLDEIGTFIWQQIDGAKDLAMVLDTILDEFDVDRSEAEADLLQFAEGLLDAELLITS
jgi:hypothetical protein